ncbi:MAG: aminotransferase class V-fold PLP-dependent enzyme [Acidobacteria bacterium]|nr:aminotransferase class V-fold PLP-dependent enzyme [Acidobacteriota bacterium]MBI3280553.1 aminotransferase class V-fold PLP-dependent enzyme [Acidobacteriota bacterium]
MLARFRNLTRRRLFEYTGFAAGLRYVPGVAAAAPVEGGALQIGPNLYQSIGVRPLINCKGTFTIVSGSLLLPEVRQAMMEASKHYVHLDELMDGVGRRLAALTGAEWGIVTNGCAAALTHATSACIAGADPEKMQRLPHLVGLKNEVIAPRHSRNVYDHAIRMLGVKMITVSTADQLQRAFSERTAMVMVLAGPSSDAEPMSTQTISRLAREKGVPVVVDAAAEHLTIPNKHLQAGAHMVCYSGGKCIRGPQSAGLLLGQKDLVRAAWLNSAPHHAFGRSLKVGKEEIMGMLAAVETWVKRDHDAEYRAWESWIGHIAERASQVPGVTTRVRPPRGLSNRAPLLDITWDAEKIGIAGHEVEKYLYESDPRIVLGGASRPNTRPSSITIMPYMMQPGDHKVVAERIQAVLAKPPAAARQAKPGGSAANVAGQWNLHLKYFVGTAEHNLVFEQKDAELTGTHRGDVTSGDLHGWVEGSEIRFSSRHPYEGTALPYEFAGQVSGETMSGQVMLGEYGVGEWTADRRKYRA